MQTENSKFKGMCISIFLCIFHISHINTQNDPIYMHDNGMIWPYMSAGADVHISRYSTDGRGAVSAALKKR